MSETWPPREGDLVRVKVGVKWLYYEVVEITVTGLRLRGRQHWDPLLTFDRADAIELHEQGLIEVGPTT